MATFVKVWQSDEEGRIDDDFADRLSHRVTGLILITFAVLVTTTKYVSK